MASLVGQTISHYKILETLGSGGMGVVYKAEDTRLDRVVALKFLSEQSGATSADRDRFIREARLAAGLNHQNIATIFEINAEGAVAGTPGQIFIAMEYVEGKTLREIIDGGPLKIDEAIRITVQAAEGLHAAHEKGIVHRDVKSANIMLTPRGQVKIMDFGLAKIAQGRTMITNPGSTVGTAAYMSPEQARGEGVDQRTDIWGLGVVFFEMITGSLPFRGDYANAVVYAILNEQPVPLTALRTGVPVALDSIVAKMLAKKADERYQHVEEIPVDLRNVRNQTEPRLSTVAQTSLPVPGVGRKWTWALGGIVLGAAVMAAALRMIGPAGGSPTVKRESEHLSMTLPDSLALAPIGAAPLGIGQPALAISPDGSLVAFIGQGTKSTSLCLRAINRYESVQIQGTEGAYCPFFSPDGRWIGFFAGNQIRKISVDGGAVATLCEAINPRGAAWGENNQIWFSDKEGSRLSWVGGGGGTPHELKYARGRGSGGFEYPDLLPDGAGLVCAARVGLKIISLPDGQEKLLNIQGSSPHFLNPGYLVFYFGGSLLAVAFDARRRELGGTPQPVLDGVLAETPHLAGHYDVSRTGTLIYIPGKTELDSKLVMVRRGGGETALPFPPGLFGTYQLSPDGRRLAILNRVLGMDVWIYDLQEGTRRRITTDGKSGNPIWSPDGKWIFYNSIVAEVTQMVRELADGSGKKEVVKQAENANPYAISPDGRYLAVALLDTNRGIDVKVIDLAGSAEPVLLAGTAANEWGPSFSRDGKYIAYVSDESGQYEIYVQPFPPDGRRWQVSTEGGEEPIWSGTGKELFYRRGLEWIAVEITTTAGFVAKKSSIAIQGLYVNPPGRSYDVTPDGSQFLVLERLDAKVRLTEIRVATNWFHELALKLSGR